MMDFTVILWQNTTLNAFDGDPVFRIILTRIVNGKIPFNEWYIVRESTKGREEIKEKHFVFQTVNPLKKGGFSR
jgi:hypothetical protein